LKKCSRTEKTSYKVKIDILNVEPHFSPNLTFLVAEKRLKMLEEERAKLDQELTAARRNMLLSECSKKALEAQLQAVCPSGERVPPRRANSFMPSTKERPAQYMNSLPRKYVSGSKDKENSDSEEQ